MPMTRARSTAVLLVRHGTTPTTGMKLPGRAPGLHLSDEGRRQADGAAQRIGALRRVAAVYASPIDRARETALPIAPSGFRFPGGESFVEVQARMTAAVMRLVERHPGGTIVVVSHADPIKTLVAHAMGTPLDLFQRFVIAPASITVIAWRRDAPLVLAVNSLGGDLAAYGFR